MPHASIDPLLEPFCHWQDGAWRTGDGPSFPVTNPADGALLATVADQGAAEAEAAITHAHAGSAMAQLAKTTALQRRTHALYKSGRSY